MPDRAPILILALAALLLGSGAFIYLALRSAAIDDPSAAADTASNAFGRKPSDIGADFVSTGRGEALDRMADALELAELDRILGVPGAIAGEAILTFQTDEAYRRFLEAAARLGIRILGYDPRTRSVRIGFDSPSALQSALASLDPGDYEVGANQLFIIPTVPLPTTPDNPGQILVPFGNRTLDWLGVRSGRDDWLTWGVGIVVAVLDTGVAPHSTFRDGQVTQVDFLDGASADGGDKGHGTAVASLIAGNDSQARGVAPGADILSYDVINKNGTSDSFTLATAIYDAIAKNVDLINISLGSYGNSTYLERAVFEAIGAGIAIIASAGNEGQQGRLAYPAAYEGVIGVGAVDALGQHVYYSNAGGDLDISAPGIGVAAAWEGDQFVSFSGTSASAPLVAGTWLAIESENPGITYAQTEALLYEHANEAGLPGPDPEYGNGNLDIGRIMQRDTPGIYDVAIASQTFADPAIPTNNANPTIDVAVENRGTETLYNVQVNVSSPGIERNFTIPLILPDDIAVVQAPIDSARAQADGSLEVVSTVTLSNTGTFDADTRDNSQTSVISITPAAGP